MDELTEEIIQKGGTHFLEMSGGDINATELVATLINQKDKSDRGDPLCPGENRRRTDASSAYTGRFILCP